MPLRVLLLLAFLVLPRLGGGQIQRGHRRSAWRVTQLRIAPEISDKNNFVHAAHELFLR